MYSTDNGPHYNTWPDAGTTPFRSEKNSNWEGAYRVPAFVRWPGHFPAGTTLNGIVSHEDWLPTFAAVAGDAGHQGEAAQGRRRTQRPHLPQPHRRLQPARLPHRQGEGIAAQRVLVRQRRRPGRRRCATTTGRSIFLENRGAGVRRVARAVRRTARAAALQPAARSVREVRQHNSNTYNDWFLDRVFVLVPMQQLAGEVPADDEGLPAEPDARDRSLIRWRSDQGRPSGRRWVGSSPLRRFFGN